MDNLKGPTAAFATFSYFKNHARRAWERVVLAAAPRMTDDVRKMKFLHTAHFCRVSPKHLRRAGFSPVGKLKAGGLLFMSTYNGDADAYFRAFSKLVPKTMDQVWGNCRDWKPAKDYRNLDAHIDAHRRASNVFFNAYPDTSERIRQSLRLRRGVDRLHAVAFSTVSDAAFEHAMHELAMQHWGDG